MSDQKLQELEKKLASLESQTNFRLLLVALAVLVVAIMTSASLVL